jgi:hypothetical protein
LEESVDKFFNNTTITAYTLKDDILTINNNNSTIKFVVEQINEKNADILRNNIKLHETFHDCSRLSQWLGGIGCLSIDGGITLLENNNIIFKAYRL